MMNTQPASTNEFTLPEGCVLCGSDLHVRVTESGATSVCPSCTWIAKPQVRLTHNGLKVTYLPGGTA
jgi:hypothetical protein